MSNPSMPGAAAMTTEGKLLVVAVVLAIVVPLTIVVVRRWWRGEPFTNKGIGTPPLPPDIGDLGGGGGT